MRHLGRALAVVALTLVALAGTAGLSSLAGDEDCAQRWHLGENENDGRGAAQPLSAWPPGVRCELVDARGAVLDERDPPVVGFLALVACELALLLALRRAWPGTSFALRAAVVASAALLVCGLGGLYLRFPGGWFGPGFVVAPIVGLLLDRWLLHRGARRTPFDGTAGGVVALAAVLVDTLVWVGTHGPAAHVVAVALVAAAAAVSGRRAAPDPVTAG